MWRYTISPHQGGYLRGLDYLFAQAYELLSEESERFRGLFKNLQVEVESGKASVTVEGLAGFIIRSLIDRPAGRYRPTTSVSVEQGGRLIYQSPELCFEIGRGDFVDEPGSMAVYLGHLTQGKNDLSLDHLGSHDWRWVETVPDS